MASSDRPTTRDSSTPKKPKKERADVLLVDAGLVESRTRAQAVILAGLAYVGTQRIAKPGDKIPRDAPLSLKGQDHPWVSRGGMKLQKGLEHFGVDVSDAYCIDIGASTGGFTDVLLAGGAAHVFAVDVGQAQLAWKLRQDPRVTVLEKTNARTLTSDHISQPVDIVVCDASFIGLKTILPTPLNFLKPGGTIIALIKPQFEVGKDRVGKKGVVREPELHAEVCDTIERWLADDLGWRVMGIIESPIRGPEGNIEFLIAAQKAE